LEPKVLERVFDMFDLNRNNKIEFNEFAVGLSLLCKGEEDERLEFIFQR